MLLESLLLLGDATFQYALQSLNERDFLKSVKVLIELHFSASSQASSGLDPDLT